eukprot:TRINITY_DN31144_c0_g1_i1.p1 TRINITY_DN31144_c0_g1~~TRINITY_DN31144_c0_g1_i1.p1  ORF type:complete len:523 (+),score=197.38 TRINITY_DN31144_c0_g1_i1:36-1571(+)
MGSRGVVLRRATRRASRAVRETETTDDTYYPREWYVQKENVELSLYKDVKEWRDVTGKRSPGKALPEDTRRELFWRMEQMMRTQEHHRNEKVGMFFLPYLDWSLREGCKPFLSPTHAHRLYTDLHRTHVEELTRLTAGTPAEAAPLDVLVDATAFDAANALVNFHASMHWNMLFCWKSIVPFGSVDMPVRIRRVIWQYFSENGEDQLREAFEEAAMNHVGNGFVWIVWNRALQLLEVKVTERHQCPKVLDLVPVLGLNLWDNAVAPGYGMNKLEYVKRFWHCIDWTWADYCMGLIQKDSEILHEEGARFSEEKVHRFPTQVSIRDDMLLRNRVRKSRDEPHARIKRDWEAWRTMRIRQDPGVFGPGMHMASHQDQETEFLWKVAQQYHIVHAHCQFSRPPPPTQLASWTMTRRWFNQLQAKHILRKTAVFPPASGILWPEEEDQELVAAALDDVEDLPEWDEEESPRPWKEMRERWFHSNTHEKELDFWRIRFNIANNKHGLYFGLRIKEG